VGIFTERDVLQRVVAEGRSPSATPVAAVMTTEVVCCGPETPVDEVAEMMRRERIRHVPVVAGDAVVGMVSIGDINAHRFNHCEAALHQVEDYIHRRA
jgi:CBS domain-containing protein